MKKILVIMTGGTIGSKVESNVIDIDKQAPHRLVALYHEKYGQDVSFEVIQPLSILSENMTLTTWNVLRHQIENINLYQYEGIIVTHGSDTLSYTSSFLGMMFGAIEIPLVLIASNYELSDERSNGLSNFRSGVCLIKSHIVNGVFTIYQNECMVNEVYLSTRITESDTYTDQYGSFGGKPFGYMEHDRLMLYKEPYNPSVEEINHKKGFFNNSIHLTRDILMIQPYPGLNYEFFDFNQIKKAVVHYSYHSGTVCTKETQYSLLSFLEECKRRNIDFYLASLKSESIPLYATNRELLDAGAIPMFNCSREAAYVKVLLAYNQTEYLPKDFMKQNLYYESLPEKLK